MFSMPGMAGKILFSLAASAIYAGSLQASDQIGFERATARFTPAQIAGVEPINVNTAPTRSRPDIWISPEQAAGLVPIGTEIVQTAHEAPGEILHVSRSYVPSRTVSGQCQCPKCQDQSRLSKLNDRLRIKKREVLRDHYYYSFDHYRHLNHPVCPPFGHPSWGYHQTCWSRFPEETLWCPGCPPEALSLPSSATPVLPPPPAPVPMRIEAPAGDLKADG